jgi:hypothetical protein
MKSAKILNPKEAKVLEMRDAKFTLEEVGKEIGVTRERVRQIEATARGRIEQGFELPIKEKEDVKPKVELISYSMKMVIPTGNYANIQPEIVVRAGTVEEAHDYIAPHFNKLWKEYYLCSERRPEPAKTMTDQAIVDKLNEMKVTPEQIMATPVSSVAFTKASQAIASCLSAEALEIISKQVLVSTKLTAEDKLALAEPIAVKFKELNGKVNPA